jgi:hypothetical protein
MSPKSNDRLRDLLRRGDPAAGDPGLSPDEVGRMRRAVLAATPEPRRRLLMVPVLAGLAAAVALLVVASPWSRLGEIGAPPAPEPAAAAAAATPAPTPGATPVPAPERVEPPVRLASREAPAHPRVRRHRPPEPVATMAHAEPRQIQFEAPGGTRVIWILNPTTE